MSGTSVDGIDAALLHLAPNGAVRGILAARYTPLDSELAEAVHQAGADTPLHRLCELDRRLADAFAEAADTIQRQAPAELPVAAIGCHGQTVWHQGREAGTDDGASSVQIGDPNRIAARTGLPVVADFRRRDIAEGGHGAPLAPSFHAYCWGAGDAASAVVNLGGIANLTLLPAGAGTVIGFDSGPANTLLDAWARRHLDARFDADGAWAASGRVDQELLGRLRADPYFARPPPKSTGPEHFNLEWLLAHRRGDEDPADVQATLAELTASTVADALGRGGDAPARVWVCGGGSHNGDLMRRLQAHCPEAAVASTAALGMDPDYVEAAAFAWLAWARLHHHPGNLPSVTGARRRAVLGGVYAP
ncbi:anhydro-N-acetylmuramic acid kinase [Halorhodospira halophila]|nr:anhydro-N-acetylmuramic acid kinase [Halorhodospira halophila]